MKISIITVVFNNDKTIREAITSVLSQTYSDIEYIIIDGGSSDDTLAIINEFSSSITTLISEPDRGIYDAMNKGIKCSTGQIIGILNSDDLYEDQNVLSDVMSAFEKDSELDIVYGNLKYVKPNTKDTVVRKWKSKKYYNSFFDDGNVPPHPCLFVRNVVYQKAGLFNQKYKLAADYEFMLRIFKRYKFKSKYMDRWMVRMRLGGATNSSFKNIINQNREIVNSWRELNTSPPIGLMPKRLVKRLTQFF
ncbi:glycosyltransferase family 2 protein [Desertivirga brevis]|uniref:glycosyltransferase family 2 protein n=1 Tax=Desertivirga brevis TaxID=2810310 RepID=UPI001A9741C2|nr:glycosyltransferase family 2 protein [Pedobacter sp. SYSU D00873]